MAKSTKTVAASKAAAPKKAKPAKKATAAKAAPAKTASARSATAVADEVTVNRRASERRATDRRTKSEPVPVERRALERREKVSRRRQIDPTTCERDYTPDEIEFMAALDDYKRTSGRMFPTCSEILEVFKSLGYNKGQATPMADLPAEMTQA